MNSSGDITRWVVPSRQGALSLSTTCPRSARGGLRSDSAQRRHQPCHRFGHGQAAAVPASRRRRTRSVSRVQSGPKRRRCACRVWRSRCPRRCRKWTRQSAKHCKTRPRCCGRRQRPPPVREAPLRRLCTSSGRRAQSLALGMLEKGLGEGDEQGRWSPHRRAYRDGAYRSLFRCCVSQTRQRLLQVLNDRATRRTVTLREPGRVVVAEPGLALRVFPHQRLERQIDTG